MAKVQDITTTSTYKDIIERDKPDALDEIIGVAGVIKEAINDPVTKNLENLKRKGIFDKALMASRLKQFKKNQDELSRIDTEFNGSVANYVNARNKKSIDDAILQYYNIDPTTSFKVGNPDAVYGDLLKGMNEKSIAAINKLRTAQDSLGVSGVDLNNIDTYLDEKHADAFVDLQENFKITGMDIMRNLFGTNPYNRASEEELQNYIKGQAYTKEFSEVESVNNTFRTLFNFDPAVAADFENIVKDADLRFDVNTKTGELKTEMSAKDPKGRTSTDTFRFVTTTYTDKNGAVQTKSQKVLVERGELTDINEQTHALMQQKLFPGKGMQLYFDKVNEGFSPKAAFEAVPDNYKKSLDERTRETLYNTNFEKVIDGFETHKENYYFTGDDNILGSKDIETLKPEVVAWENYSQNPQKYLEENEGVVPPKPAYYYKNAEEWARGELNIGPAKQLPVPEDNLNPVGNAYVLDENLNDSTKYQQYIGNMNWVRENLNEMFDGDFINKSESLEKQFDEGITTEFVNGTSIYIKPGTPAVTPQQLIELGLNDVLPEGNYQLGYDVKSEKLQLVNTGITEPAEIIEEEQLTSRGTRTILQTINDIPVAGDVTETLLGDTLEAGEKIFLAAGGVGITYQAGKKGVKLGKNQLGKIIINDPQTKKVMVDILEERKKGKMFGYKNARQYNNWVNRQTPLRQAAIQALNASGKSIDPTKLANNLIPKMGAIKFAKRVAGIPRAAGRFLFGSKAAIIGTLGTLGLAGYNALFDEPEDETEE